MTTVEQELTPGMEDVIRRVAKLLQLSAKNPNEEEAASAFAKANAMAAQYNLDLALIEKEQGRLDGKRENAAVEGGFYQYQRDLYEAVAKLNFCMYFTEGFFDKRDKTITRRGRRYEKGSRVWRQRHRIIGRQVNTATTKAMASYIEQTIERALRERLVDPVSQKTDTSVLFGNWGISYREGAVQRMVEKVTERHKIMVKEQEKKARADAKAAMAGASTATALTLTDVARSEEAANYDFLNGDGAWAKKLKSEAESAKWWKDELARRAKLAKDDPETYAKEEAARRKAYRGTSYSGPKERNKDWGAYRAGYEKADSFSIDRQAGSSAPAGLLK